MAVSQTPEGIYCFSFIKALVLNCKECGRISDYYTLVENIQFTNFFLRKKYEAGQKGSSAGFLQNPAGKQPPWGWLCSLIRLLAGVACSLSVFVPKRLSSHPFSPAIPISFADEEYGPEGIQKCTFYKTALQNNHPAGGSAHSFVCSQAPPARSLYSFPNDYHLIPSLQQFPSASLMRNTGLKGFEPLTDRLRADRST